MPKIASGQARKSTLILFSILPVTAVCALIGIYVSINIHVDRLHYHHTVYPPLRHEHEHAFCGIAYDEDEKTEYSLGKWTASTPEPYASCNESSHCVLTEFGLKHKAEFLERYSSPVCPERSPRRSRCHERGDSELGRIMESMRFEWTPKHCRMHQFDGLHLTKFLTLNQARLHFIGDSLQTDMSNSLHCMINNVTSFQLITKTRLDSLGYEKHINSKASADSTNKNWRTLQSQLQTNPQDVLVINLGAHWTHSSMAARKSYWFAEIATAIDKSVKAERIIFRANIMGHKRCEKFTKPLNVEEMTDDVKAKFSDAYNWKDFESINHDLIPQFRSVFNANATAKQFYVLDVSITALRLGSMNGIKFCTTCLCK